MAPDQVQVQLTLAQLAQLLGFVGVLVGMWLDLRYQVRMVRKDLGQLQQKVDEIEQRVDALEQQVG